MVRVAEIRLSWKNRGKIDKNSDSFIKRKGFFAIYL